MLTIQDINNIECDGAAESELEYYASIQRAINSGMWGLQGSYGRTMMAAIKDGYCMLGKQPARDYYGSYIPSRAEVKAGTKGSFEYVADAMGAEYAELMASI